MNKSLKPTEHDKKTQLNLTARENHQDYEFLLEIKKVLTKLEKENNLSKIQILAIALAGSNLVVGNYTESEKENFRKLSVSENVSVAEIIRRGSILYTEKLLADISKVQDSKISENEINLRGDRKVAEIVEEMMLANDAASYWWDKREINAKSIIDWGKKYKNFKSINYKVIQRYFMFYRQKVSVHHLKHDIKNDHNRRAINKIKASKPDSGVVSL